MACGVQTVFHMEKTNHFLYFFMQIKIQFAPRSEINRRHGMAKNSKQGRSNGRKNEFHMGRAMMLFVPKREEEEHDICQHQNPKMGIINSG